MSELSAKALIAKTLDLSKQLKAAGIHHEVRLHREDALSIVARVPDALWEIDVLEDGRVDVEILKSSPLEEDPTGAIEKLIRENKN